MFLLPLKCKHVNHGLAWAVVSLVMAQAQMGRVSKAYMVKHGLVSWIGVLDWCDGLESWIGVVDWYYIFSSRERSYCIYSLPPARNVSIFVCTFFRRRVLSFYQVFGFEIFNTARSISALRLRLH